MQSIVSVAAFRACASLIAAACSPSRRVVWEEAGPDWMTARKCSDVALAFPDGSGLEVALKGRLWVLTTEARPAPAAALGD